MCDDFSGYIARRLRTAGSRMPDHARRKFFDPCSKPKPTRAVCSGATGKVYEIERQAKELSTGDRLAPQKHSQPILYALHEDAAAMASCLTVSHGPERWTTASSGHHAIHNHPGNYPVDSNWIENQIRPIAVGRITGCSPEVCARANGRLR